MPVIDKTAYTAIVDLMFSTYPLTMTELRKELQKYDLDLIEGEREIEIFVMREK